MFIRSTVLVAASAALAALAVPAAAGSLEPVVATPVPAAPVAPTPVLNQAAADGDWTGGYAGVQLSFGTAEVDDVFGDEESDGALFGVNSGYRYDFGRIVLGGEVSYDATDITLPNDVDVDSVLRAGVTAGYDAGRILPYVTAGYAGASFSEELAGEDRFDGGFYGLGAAYQVTDRIAVSAEVLQHRFDLDTLDADADVTTFGIKAAYRF
jgi:opacity protein-like surface antigen